MIEDLTKYTKFLVDHEVTPKQLYLLFCLFLDRLEEEEDGRLYRQYAGSNRPMANLYRYANNVERWTIEEVNDLEEKELLVNRNDSSSKPISKENGFFPDNMEVTPKFINLVFSMPSDFEEFWEVYPDFVPNFDNPVSGPKVPLKLVSYEEMMKLYKKAVNTKIEHSRMMRCLKWGQENGQINMRLDKFLESRHWKSLEKLMDDSYGSEKTRGHIL